MIPIWELWLPIIAAAAGVWVASALAWMLVGHHGKDWDRLPNEDAALEALRGLSIPPGVYSFPHVKSHKEGQTPEAKEKWSRGPMGLLRVWRPINMGRNMALTLVFFVVVSGLVGYVGSACLPRGAEFMKVWQVLGTVSGLAYGAGFVPNDLWFQNKPRATLMCVLDGAVFGLISGAIFAALWPAAA